MKFRSSAVGAAAAAAAAAAMIAALAPHPIAWASAHPAARWSATWASAMQPPVAGNPATGPNWSGGFSDQTIRQVIRVSSGGRQVRVRLSNLYSTKPLQVTGATIARTRDGATVEPGTVRSLTFDGARSAATCCSISWRASARRASPDSSATRSARPRESPPASSSPDTRR